MNANLDFRDWFLPGGGKSRLTTRRLLVIVTKVLSKDNSHFWKAVQQQDEFDAHGILLADIFTAVSGETHPLREFFYDRSGAERKLQEEHKKRVEREERKRLLREISRKEITQ